MNIHQIIHSLCRLKSGERRRKLVEWGVDSALWPAIMECFNQEGLDISQETIQVCLTDGESKGKIVDAIILEQNCIKFKDDKGIWNYTTAWELVQEGDSV